MQILGIDIETYSSNDIAKGGVYKYVEAHDFEVLMLAYSIDGGKPEIIDLADFGDLPDWLVEAIQNPDIKKTAYNAQFERICLSRHLGVQLDPAQWYCTMVKAAMVGYPFELDKVATVMKLQQEKDKKGKDLIRYFSIPCKPTIKNKGRTRNLPHHDAEKWRMFKEYCKQDVVVEQAILRKLEWFRIPPRERDMWILDQKINDRGILLDEEFVRSAIAMNELHTKELISEAQNLSGLDNPNSVAQLKTWLEAALETDISSLNKTEIPKLIKSAKSDTAKRMLEIRQELAKTSIKKYVAMLNCVCGDGRVRGLLRYYGANRTGRWSSQLIQIQNLPQNHLSVVELARDLVKTGDYDSLQCFYGSIPNTLSQLIRSSFIAGEGKKIIGGDFSSIEIIVAAWIAGEKWVIDEYKTTRKIYEKTASRMFNIPMEQITKDSPERQQGKISALALQFGGTQDALTNMDRDGLISDSLKPLLVQQWRLANPRIVATWWDMDRCAKSAMEGIPAQSQSGHWFRRENGALTVQLSTGRKLFYLNPRWGVNRFGGTAIVYDGLNQMTKKWETKDIYGPKFFQNIVQATARDCMGWGMLRLDKQDITPIMTVHDEVVAEAPVLISKEDIIAVLTKELKWAPGLPLAAAGFESSFYKK